MGLSLGLGAAQLLGCHAAPPEATGGFVGPSVALGHRLRQPLQRPAAAQAQQRQADVLVLGGGVAGLAAARRLAQQGREVAVLELEASAGGNARGHVLGGVPCPLGAHYLPVPNAQAGEVQQLLADMGLAQWVLGRFRLTPAGERHLCHSPQERVFAQGRWQEGLLPLDGASPASLAQVQAFARWIAQAQASGAYRLPVVNSMSRPLPLADRSMAQALAERGLHDPLLLGYLDYCCRDDYGAGIHTVSAWAGVHYFASRHGFAAPGVERGTDSSSEGVLTWPTGNGHICAWLAAQLGPRLVAQQLAVHVQEERQQVQVWVLDVSAPAAPPKWTLWRAKQVVLALPLRVAGRLLPSHTALQALAQATPYSAWVVSNLLLSQPLDDPSAGPGTAWDNVVFGSAALGYVDARHQDISAGAVRAGPTVLTHYTALGTGAAAAQQLLDRPWTHWRDQILDELQPVHLDLRSKLQHTQVTRYGHAMAVPTPASAGLHERRLQLAQSGLGKRIHYAHSDLAGYSVFEEAYTAGVNTAKAFAQS